MNRTAVHMAISTGITQGTFCVMALVLAGCAFTRPHKNEAAARSLDRAAAAVQAESRALDASMWSLNDLVNKPGVDLKPQFQRFSSALDRLVASARRAGDTAGAVREKSTAYLQSWDKEMVAINYEAIRRRSGGRRAEVSNQFDAINRLYHEVQSVVEPLIDYLEDIRTARKTDLTIGGLEAAKNLVSQANENAGKVQTSLAQLASDLALSSNRVSSLAQQTAQPEAKAEAR